MSRQLTWLREGRKAGSFLLDLPDVIVGRGRSAQVRLDDNKVVSRQHCVIRERGAGHVVEDLGGANGTFVNDAKITAHPLRPGDRIVLGVDILRYDLALPDAQSLRAQRRAEQVALRDVEVEELSIGDVATADDLDDLRSQHRPAAAPQGEARREATFVADRGELERLMAEMTLRSQPHLIVVGTDPEVAIGLTDPPLWVGYDEGCRLRLPGTRLLPGRRPARVVQQLGGWCVVPEAPFWSPVRVQGQVLRKLRLLQDGDRIEIRGTTWEFRRGGAR